LRKLARRAGDTEASQIEFLVSDSVQCALAEAFEASAASSLPVERKHACAKKNEAARLCHVSTAGRNELLRAYLRERDGLLRAASSAEAALARTLKQRITSLAWERRPDFLGRPLGCTAGEGAECSDSAQPHDAAGLRAYVNEQRAALLAEVRLRRQNAQKELEQARSFGPVSERDWIAWFAENQDFFGQRMKVATQERRTLSRRLKADGHLQAAVDRLQPSEEKVDTAALPRWQQVLWGRTGFFGVKTQQGSVKGFFLYTFRRRTWALNLGAWQRSARRYEIVPQHLELGKRLRPLQQCIVLDAPAEQFALHFKAAAAPGVLTLRASVALPVTGPLPRSRRRGTTRAASGSESAEDFETDEEADAQAREDASSAESDCMSVDTQVDSDADSACEDLPKLKSAAAALRAEAAAPVAAAAPDSEGEAVSDLEEDASESAHVGSGFLRRESAHAGSGFLRRAAGTWKVWESQWFFMTQTPGFLDLKVQLKVPLRNVSEGMGVTEMSKALSPHLVGGGDTIAQPVRTKFLLRAWTIWRSRWLGWAAQKEYRLREVAVQEGELEAELRAFAPPSPGWSLGSTFADEQLYLWVRELVERLRCGPENALVLARPKRRRR